MATVERRRLRVTGTVQGVGFRPFVYRHAVALGLVGFVRNDSAGVLIEAEGPPARLAELGARLRGEAPPLARVTGVAVTTLDPTGRDRGFEIVDSDPGGPVSAAVSVDTATCPACLAEVDDPGDRRHRYPFVNCTDCGPRYTIVTGVPYDRPATTMAGFAMCADCRHEYDDPRDRRFHAQPNACPVCGPQLVWLDPDGRPGERGDAALQRAVTRLASGGIVAVKGVGGFHLAVDATDDAAVAELRRRKARDDKPFALMVPDLAAARSLCVLDPAGESALTDARRPIVLAPRRPGAAVAAGVAPGLPELGTMLPYSALHHLLLGELRRPLVMTSGNLSDDPIAHRDDDAVTRLGPMADGLLSHDRPIHIRCDDSVLRAAAGTVQLLRRSRGYAPEPMALAAPARRAVLAVGAELKSTVTVGRDGWLVTSHHVGDLEHLATYRSFTQAVGHLARLFAVVPEVVAHDLHPEYLSTKAALELDLPAWGIQHHHAHVAACLADHGLVGPVLGVAFDGLGYGADGTLWGGEFLVAGLEGCHRAGHLRQVVMPGGAAAIREPWRMAMAWAHAVGRAHDAAALFPDEPTAAAVAALVDAGHGPRTSSAGRLFDAVAALIGLRRRVTYEGQAAIELEAAAGAAAPGGRGYSCGAAWVDGRLVLDPAPLVAAVLEDRGKGVPGAQVAAAFHHGLAAATVTAAADLAARHGLDTVALTGGVFQNARFGGLVATGLRREGLGVLVHRRVPPNDGGISVGQAAIAATAAAPPPVT